MSRRSDYSIGAASGLERCGASITTLSALTRSKSGRTTRVPRISPESYAVGTGEVGMSRGVKAGTPSGLDPNAVRGEIFSPGSNPNPNTPLEDGCIPPVPTLTAPVDVLVNPSQVEEVSEGLEEGSQWPMNTEHVIRNPKEPPLENPDAEGSQPLSLGRERELDNESLAYRPKQGRSSADLVSAVASAQASWAKTQSLNVLQEDGFSYQTPWWYYKGGIFIPPEPQDLRTQVLAELHDTPYQGHKGVKRTIQAAKQHGINWKGMQAAIENSFPHVLHVRGQNPTQPKIRGLWYLYLWHQGHGHRLPLILSHNYPVP